ncbi:MAG: Cation transport regulator ChaB [Chlamydiae bacterium]|nr:Cation transport regulator ChaB [Chlamydiota bacterium]
MPYKEIDDLPPRVKSHLPKGALEIYLEAFNHAWQQYADPKKRTMGGDQEEVAHRVAWAAVKKKYEKGSDNNWHKIS